jgi:hypothetical protein
MAPEHWLSYSHSDQALLRDPGLTACWDAIVVPGTLATFYFEGTGGFVLAQRAPYIIDPRTPLLQTVDVKRPAPRASHLKLLEVHDPDAVGFWPDREIELTHWQDGRWPSVVSSVLDFQAQYSDEATGKLKKYERLKAKARGEEPAHGLPTDGPKAFVPPYWAVTGKDDPWWKLSRSATEIAVARFPGQVRPIVALQKDASIGAFAELLRDMPAGVSEVFCWRGSWTEADATKDDINDWLAVISNGYRKGIAVTNLYGGYLSVLLTGLGLAGLSHGVGYSESRDVRRLGETGAPLMRYYVPAIHAFLTVPSAQPMIDHLPSEWACSCEVCKAVYEGGRPVVSELPPEARKRHFLLARAKEMKEVDADLGGQHQFLFTVADWLKKHPLREIGTEKYEKMLRTWADGLEPHLP